MKKFLLLAALLPALAFGHGAPVIWNGTSAKWLPSGLNSAGVCKLSAAGVMSSSTVSDSELASSYLYADGTRALTGNWNAGANNITASTFIGALTGNASTATALASNPTDCGAGTKATSIDASGNLTCSAVSLTADVSGTLPVANGGTGTSTQFTVGSAIFAGASGVYAEDNANFFWDDSNNRLGIGTASPGYKLDIAASGTNETVLSLDPSSAGGSDVDFRFEGASNAIFRVDRGIGSLLVFSGGYLNVGGTRTPLNQLEVQVASTNTTPASGLTQNVASLPLFAAVNNSSTANNWSAYCYAGASNGSTGLDACMVATHTDHTNGSEDADWSVWLATNGTKNNRLNLTNAGVLTLSGYGAGVLQADSSGVISSAAVDLATSDVTGTLPVANGGTGQTTYTDGQLLIGNSSGNTLTKATITAGTGISVTNGNGSITIASTGGGTPAFTTFTADDTVSTSDEENLLCDCNDYCQITLYAADNASRKAHTIKNIGSATCEIIPDSGDDIDGDTSLILSAGGSPQSANTLKPNGSASWYVY